MKTSSIDRYKAQNLLLPIAIGVAAFFLIAGPRALVPTNIAWLNHGDPAQHYLGWLFFRNSDWFFPLGLNPSYGLELSSAIVFSDSNPLMAFIFKPFSFLLPDTFQYFGIWLLLCFILQAWFGWKLSGLISRCLVVRAFGSAMFAFSPPMIWRLYGHLSLVGHFTILAALYLVFGHEPRNKKLAWGVLLGMTALIHAYLLAMVTGLWLSDLLQRKYKIGTSWRQAGLELFQLILALGIVCGQAGYFSIGDGIVSGGFGHYRMNVLSIIDPSGWSYIFKDIPEAPGNYEGFNYLGSGIVFIFLVSIPKLFFLKISDCANRIRRFPFFALLLLVLILFALSNKVIIGSYELAEYPFPKILRSLAQTFRASGRMFWPVFYTIVLCTIFLVVRNYPKRVALWLLGIALAIQIADTSAAWKKGIRDKMMTMPTSAWSTPLISPFWEEAALRYRKVREIFPGNALPHWKNLASYAATHGMATNAVYLARVDTSALNEARDRAMETIRSGEYETDSLYVIEDSTVLQAFLGLGKSDFLARIDGFNVLAPGWRHCKVCMQPSEFRLNDMLPPVETGLRIPVGSGSTGRKYLPSGWEMPVADGAGSIGKRATIALPIPDKSITSVMLEIIPFLAQGHPQQHIVISANGVMVDEISLTTPGKQKIEIKIPESALKGGRIEKLLELELALPDAVSPKELGISGDSRELAIHLLSFTVH